MRTVRDTNINIFDLATEHGTAICVTTNGMIKKNGRAVMGAGIAKEADTRFDLGGILGEKLRLYGNHVHELKAIQTRRQDHVILSFPTKDDWRDRSTIKRITQSAYELMAYCIEHDIHTVYLPPAGCSCGGLDWETQVEPVLNKILDDRCITVIQRPHTPAKKQG